MTEVSGLTLRTSWVDISPQAPLALFGRGGRSGAHRGVSSALQANYLLIEGDGQVAALVTLDSLYPSRALSDAIIARAGQGGLALKPETLLLVASHTHNAPALDATKPKLGVSDPAYLALVAERIADGLLALRATPAGISTLSLGHATCGASVFRRRRIGGIDLSRLRLTRRTIMAPRPGVSIDQTLKLVAFCDEDGVPQLVLWSWPCHAVSEPDAMAISADFPGVARDHLRRVLGNTSLSVMYLPGFSSDIRPASRAGLPIHKSGRWIGLGPRFARPTKALAQALHAALRAALDGALESLQPVGPVTDAGALRLRRRQLAVSEIRDGAGNMAPLTCDDWRLGPLTIKAVSAEVASGYSAACGGEDPMTFLTGCAQQVFGYVPTDSQIPERGYEVSGFAPAFSVPGAFRDRIEDKILDLIGRTSSGGSRP